MKNKSALTKDNKVYTDKYIRDKLEEWYGREHVIRLKDYLYVVLENKQYYLMNQSVPKVFFTEDGKKLEGIISIKVNNDYAVVEYNSHQDRSSLLEGHISSIINELQCWE
jgi:hypothetical protein